MVEKFKDVGPFLDSDGDVLFEIEKNEDFERNVGKLWVGSSWITVEEARQLREYLNKVIP